MTAIRGFVKIISFVSGKSNIGAKTRFATRSPRINPIDLLIKRSVGIDLICCINFFLSCKN